MKCPYCGQTNSDRAKKCSYCGRRLDRVREKRKEKRILVYGIILVILILAAGIGAMYAVSRAFTSHSDPAGEGDKVTIVHTPVPAQTEAPAEEEQAELEEQAEPEETPAPQETPQPEQNTLQVALVDEARKQQLDEMGYYAAYVANVEATSTIYQEGVDNNPYVLFDWNDYSSWQDGVDGDGIGESITATFDREYTVRYITVRLGNWYGDDSYYYGNNRPQTMTFELGGQRFQMTFPDEKKEFCIELSKDLPATDLRVIIDRVYKGTEYEDTCINEITVYGM